MADEGEEWAETPGKRAMKQGGLVFHAERGSESRKQV